MLCSIKKKGQVTIFVIIALVIVAGIGAYIYTRSNNISPSSSYNSLDSVFNYYQNCISSESKLALALAGNRGGYLDLPKYSSPSAYAPFSSELNFVGTNVPYWSYISGNGIIKEQAPTKADVEKQIANFLNKDLISKCTFDEFYAKGWDVKTASPDTKVSISDNSVEVAVNMNTIVSNENSSASKKDYSVSVESKFGSLLSAAQTIYQREKQENFLENYTLDVLYLYAPVDGVEIGCSPKVWKSREVENNLKEGLEGNIAALKFGQKSDYFNVPVSLNGVAAQTIYSKSWPSKLEITGADGELMKTNPVGQESGLGAFGFCYQPYHFVYSLMYPIMFQLTAGEEIFQFPVVVQIKDNTIGATNYSLFINDSSSEDLCQYSTQDLHVSLKNISLKPIEGEISYTCFDQQCDVGKTNSGELSGKVPACLNGFLKADAEGYSSKEMIFSSHNTSEAQIVLDRLYAVNISVSVDGKITKNNVLVSLSGAEEASAAIPGNAEVKLSEGFYNVTIYVYGNTSITIPATKTRQCTNVPASGLLGIIGSTKEQCYDIDLPETKLDSALVAGGKGEVYLLPEMLQSGELRFSVQGLPVPKSIDDLQTSYSLFDTQGVDIIK